MKEVILTPEGYEKLKSEMVALYPRPTVYSKHVLVPYTPAGEKLVTKLWANTRLFKRELKKRGFQWKASETPIVPIHVGDAAKAFEFSKKLFDAGVFAPAVGYPTVAEGKARLRAIVSAGHKKEQLVKAVDILAEVAKPLEIIA